MAYRGPGASGANPTASPLLRVKESQSTLPVIGYDTNNKILSFPSENVQIQILWETYTLIVCLILILVVTFSVILSLKNKYEISAHLILKFQLAWHRCYNLNFLSFTELSPMFGQASHILNKHYCKPATQLQYVLFYSLLRQLFLHI